MKNWLALPILLSALLAGCSDVPTYQLSDADRAKYSQSSPEELIAATDARLKKAEKDELPFYAPISYRQAKAAQEQAVKYQQKRGAIEEVITNIAAADNRLDNGYQNMDKARALLAPNRGLDKRLQELQAPKVATSEYKALAGEMGAICELIDRGEMPKAESKRAALTSAQQELKVRLVKAQALAELKALHAKLDADGAEKVVPVAMKEARTAYQALDGFIAAHADDSDAIATRVDAAMVLAQRAQWMATRARLLAKIDNTTIDVEKLLAEEEKWLLVIGEAVGGETLRHLPPAEQAAKLAERIRRLNAPAAPVPAAAPQASEPAQNP